MHVDQIDQPKNMKLKQQVESEKVVDPVTTTTIKLASQVMS